MTILEIILNAQSGALVHSLATVAGLEDHQVAQAFERLVPEIAGQIRQRASNPEEFEDLMDVLEDGEHDEYLDDPKTSLGRKAVQDGEDILTHIYGSLEDARDAARQLGAPTGVAPEVFARLMSFAATFTVAAMARRNDTLRMGIADEQPAQHSIVAMLIGALIEGVMAGLKSAIRPRRRARRNYGRRYTSSKRKRSRARRRRTKSPSLNDLIGDLFKS